jgi:hypothetical protein
VRRGRAILLAVGLLAIAAPARAQIEPPPLPLPTVPPEAQPVLEVIGPIASPYCGNATLVVALLPGLLGGAGLPALPINIFPLLGPAFVVCGSIPPPDGSSLVVCAADDQVLALLSTVTVAAAGIPPPVDTRIVGPLVEVVAVLEDQLPPPLNSNGVAAQVRGALACRAARDTPAPQPDAEPEEEVAAVADEPIPDILSFAELPVDDLPALDAAGGANQVGSSAAPALAPVAGVRNTGFAYPVVFAFPLLVLVLGGYLGRALTRPVHRPHP